MKYHVEWYSLSRGQQIAVFASERAAKAAMRRYIKTRAGAGLVREMPTRRVLWRTKPSTAYGGPLRVVREDDRASGNPAKKRTASRVTKSRTAKRSVRASVRANPRGVCMSKRVTALYYVHAEDGKVYVHKFAPGVSMYALGDHEIVIRRPDGKPVSQNF